jgi:hypothetical protein
VDQSRAILPRPACGESPRTAARQGGRSGVGVRGVLATAASTSGAESCPHPLAEPRAAPDLSPRAGRGDWPGTPYAAGPSQRRCAPAKASLEV